MAGGLLNIVSVGNNNSILTGNPSKTFFKVTYSKYSNFGGRTYRIHILRTWKHPKFKW